MIYLMMMMMMIRHCKGERLPITFLVVGNVRAVRWLGTMQLRHLRTVQAAEGTLAVVTAIAFSPNGRRLAGVGADRIVNLFDEQGERRERFPTKAGSAEGGKNYVITGLAFSPDSTRLALAQSDGIVFVYKLGLEWGEKKSICNKFPQETAVTALTWPADHLNELVFGCADGKIRLGVLNRNRPAILYSTDSPVVSLCSRPDGGGVLSGHTDGSVFRFLFAESEGRRGQVLLVVHPSIPQTVAWGVNVMVAALDRKVVFYDDEGFAIQRFDLSNDEGEKEFACSGANSSGECVVVGGYNRFHVFVFNRRSNSWDHAETKHISNYYTVTSLQWSADGARLALASSCGAVDLYDTCVRKYQWKGKFEFTYVSECQVIIKRLASGERIVLKSLYGYEITKTDVFHDRFLVGRTPETLLLGDLETCQLSEIPWNGSGKEKFSFDAPGVAMISNAGELTLVEYSHNEVLGTCRTDHVSPNLVSIRLVDETEEGTNPPPRERRKIIAFLIDAHSIRMQDLEADTSIASITHDSRVDWLELNPKATKLLFRDKRRHLHLFDLSSLSRTTLLSFCSYAQWVPDSDVVVAQSRGNLNIWYNIDSPEKVTVFPLKGDVIQIERTKGRTEVIVDEGIATVAYRLDEALIEFDSLLESKEYERCVRLLEDMELTSETEAMWSKLSEAALDDEMLLVAERAYAALGNTSRARYLHEVNKLVVQVEEGLGQDGISHFMVKAKLAILAKDFRSFERILLEQGQVEDVMEIYQDLHKYEESIAVAELKGHPDVANLKRNYFQWLVDTNQEEKAGSMKEKEGDFTSAVKLYLRGGLPARAAQLVSKSQVTFPNDTLETIAQALFKVGMYDRAGDFFERLNLPERAIEAYRKGHMYRRAVDLSRQFAPQRVVFLEEEWGDWLVSQKQVDAASYHYIEARQNQKAIDAALSARQWSNVVDIAESFPPEESKPYFIKVASHYESIRNLEQAEKLFIKGGALQEAVEMYTRVNRWEDAHRIALHMSAEDVNVLYISQAKRLENEGKFKEAERLYITVNEPDLAINMYKKHRQFDHMTRLVATYHKGLLQQTHKHIAQQMETESNFKLAEKHYVEAKDWKAAVNMYRTQDLWEDAIRVAKMHGGINASKQVSYAWALSLGGEAGAKLLTKLGLVEQAIDYAVETGNFDFAFDMARNSLKAKLPDVFVSYAMYLEDEGRFKEAEEHFIKGEKPREAIDMYIDVKDWDAAIRVAEEHDKAAMPHIYAEQATYLFQEGNYTRAEQLFLRAQRADLAVAAYKQIGMWNDAHRLAKEYLDPHKLNELVAEMTKATGEVQGTTGGMATALLWEGSRDFSRAIDAYLQLSSHDIQNPDELAAAWERSIQLANNHVHSRIHEVHDAVGRKLLQIGNFDRAAELFKVVKAYREAIDAYARGNNWDAAEKLAATHAPELKGLIQDKRKDFFREHSMVEDLAMSGNVKEALELYAQKGQWDKCLGVAQQQGSEAVQKYVSLYCSRLMQQERHRDALRLLEEHGPPPQPVNFPLYVHLAEEALANYDVPDRQEDLRRLRGVLFNLVGLLQRVGEAKSPSTVQFERLLLITHFTTLRMGGLKEFPEFAAKLAVSLLRFVDILPADKMFYEAGVECRERGWLNMAFVFLNRYIDICDIIDDPDLGDLENADFVETDIPFDFSIPKEHSIEEHKRDDVREWVLSVAMDRTVGESLSTVACAKCGSPKYVASLVCFGCNHEYDPCMITGYPISPNHHIKCPSCGNVATQEDWNEYVAHTKTCPWCGNVQSPIY